MLVGTGWLGSDVAPMQGYGTENRINNCLRKEYQESLKGEERAES